jgi:hypothetical protein
MVDALLYISREFQSTGLLVSFHIGVQARLVYRYLAFIQPRNLVFVDIDTDNVIAHFSHAGAGDKANISGSKNRQSH